MGGAEEKGWKISIEKAGAERSGLTVCGVK
jgi:hypothetical protein